MKFRDLIFSTPSKVLHTAWFVAWFAFGLNINLLTLIVSLEAIYLELFLGDSQDDLDDKLDSHHESIKQHISNLKEKL